MGFRSVIFTCRFTETMIAASKELHRNPGQLALSPSQTHARTHAHKCKVLWQIPHFILHFKGTWVNSSLLSLPLSLPLFPDHRSSLRVWSMPFFFFYQHLDASFHTGAPSDYLWQINRASLPSRLLPVITRTWHPTYLLLLLLRASLPIRRDCYSERNSLPSHSVLWRLLEVFFNYYLFLETEPRRAHEDEGSQWKACSLVRMSVLSCCGFCCKCRR